jgi:CheY-like chemotaxis protein
MAGFGIDAQIVRAGLKRHERARHKSKSLMPVRESSSYSRRVHRLQRTTPCSVVGLYFTSMTAKLRVLVVDDLPDSAESLARLLATMGHEALFVTQASKALEAARQMRPHLVFLDLGMPEINGHQLARLFRAEFGFEALRLVAITAWGRSEDRAASRQAGFDAHVQKPAEIDIIDSIIKTVFEAPQKPRPLNRGLDKGAA